MVRLIRKISKLNKIQTFVQKMCLNMELSRSHNSLDSHKQGHETISNLSKFWIQWVKLNLDIKFQSNLLSYWYIPKWVNSIFLWIQKNKVSCFEWFWTFFCTCVQTLNSLHEKLGKNVQYLKIFQFYQLFPNFS